MIQNKNLLVPLTSMEVGREGIIKSLKGGANFHVRLQTLNIRIGKHIKKISKTPFCGPIVVEIDNARVWLILEGERSNEFSPASVKTNSQGEFLIKSVPRYFGKPDSISAESQRRSEGNNVETEQRASSEVRNKVREA